MSEWHYRYAGVDVSSSLELPEWSSFAIVPTTQAAEVLIRQTEPIEGCSGYTLDVDREKLTFGLPKLGYYCIYAGHKIVLTPCVGAAAAELRLFLLGSAWGALGYQRGWFPLHASVVQIDDGAVAFCAPSGSGKSSLAAWLVAKGCPLVSDDLCRLDVTGDQPPRVWHSAPRLKLWQDALMALDWQDKALCRDQMCVDKFHLPAPMVQPPKNKQAQPLPLRALYVLTWGEEFAIQVLHGLHAVQTVMDAATYRSEFVAELGQPAVYWQQTIDLVRHVPVFRLQRPRDWRTMAAVGETLIEHVKRLQNEGEINR